MKNTRLLIALAVAVLAVVIIVVISLLRGSSQETYHISPVVAGNFRDASIINTNQAYFFNGDAFMKFDFSTQTATALTPRYSLPNVVEVRWSSTGALFKATNYTGADQLLPQLTAAGAPTDAAYWWFANFATGTITPVGSLSDAAATGTVVDDVVWVNGGAQYYYLQTPTFPDADPITTLYRGTVGSPSQALAQTTATDLLWADAGHVVYQIATTDSHQLQLLDTVSLKATVVSSTFQGLAAINGTGTKGLLITDTSTNEGTVEATGPLELRDLTSTITSSITQSFSGSLAWSHDGTSWAALDASTPASPVAYVQGSDSKQRQLHFAVGKNASVPANLTLIGYEGDRLFMVDSNNDAYIAAVSLPSFKTAPSNNDSVSVTGTTGLLDQGVSAAQVDDLTFAINKYAQSTNKTGVEAVIGANSIVAAPVDPSSTSTVFTLNFDVTLGNDATLKAQLDCDGLSIARLYLRNTAGTLVYDSGNVNLTGN